MDRYQKEVINLVTTAVLTGQIASIILKAVWILAWSWPVIFTPTIAPAVLYILGVILAAFLAKLLGIQWKWTKKDSCLYYKQDKDKEEK